VRAEQTQEPIEMTVTNQTGCGPALLSVEDAKSLSATDVADLFRAHMNPGQLNFLRLLGFHDVLIDRAEGMHYTDKGGRRILDFFGGFGSLAHGHNHPRLNSALIVQTQQFAQVIFAGFTNEPAEQLALELIKRTPRGLNHVFYSDDGDTWTPVMPFEDVEPRTCPDGTAGAEMNPRDWDVVKASFTPEADGGPTGGDADTMTGGDADKRKVPKGGCDCRASEPPALGWLMGTVGVVVRRRRAQRRAGRTEK